LQALCAGVKQREGTLHLLGLIGNGGVHALDRHLEGALELARRHGLTSVAIHAFLDGRDTPPKSAANVMRDVLRAAAETAPATRTQVASLRRRYFAMDRDRRWDRTRLAYDAMVRGVGRPVTDPVQGIPDAYARGETDEFVKPLIVVENDSGQEQPLSAGGGTPVATIKDGDGVFCFNFRADRMRQIVRALMIEGFDGFDTGPRPRIDVVTMTQ